MYNIFLACDAAYYKDWCINCVESISKHTPWIDIHVLVVNPEQNMKKLEYVTYYEDFVNFPNDTCKVAYYQAVRFIKVADIFKKGELVMSLDCDTVLTQPFTRESFDKVCKKIHVQRHQKDKRWMAGLVTYGNDNNFRQDLKNNLLRIPIEHWRYGWDQDILNELETSHNYNKLMVGDWMSFGRGGGTFLTLKGDQKTSLGYINEYKKYI
jgi:hypothetical protein